MNSSPPFWPIVRRVVPFFLVTEPSIHGDLIHQCFQMLKYPILRPLNQLVTVAPSLSKIGCELYYGLKSGGGGGGFVLCT